VLKDFGNVRGPFDTDHDDDRENCRGSIYCAVCHAVKCYFCSLHSISVHGFNFRVIKSTMIPATAQCVTLCVLVYCTHFMHIHTV